MRKLKVRKLLGKEQNIHKIDPDSQTIDELMVSIESSVWQTNASSGDIPLLTTYALIHWVFDYPHQSNGYGFPFDRPYLDFYRRLQKIHRLLAEIIDVHLSSVSKDNKPYFQVYRTFNEVVKDKRLNALAASLERKAVVFDKLRTAMRIALPEGKNGINDNGDDVDIKSIEEKVITDTCLDLIDKIADRKIQRRILDRIENLGNSEYYLMNLINRGKTW